MVGKTKSKHDLLDKLFVGLLMVIFGGIVLHTPISVFLSSNFPDLALLIKSWKEILMIVAGLVAAVVLLRKKRINILNDPLILLIGCFGLLHLVLAIFSNGNMNQIFAGLAIDLRYLFYFALVYIALRLYPERKTTFINIGIAGAVLVVVFGLLQATILPKDVLEGIGYGPNTIAPYMTVDKDESFIRINSTMRGPNPLGAYCVIALGLAVAFLCKQREHLTQKKSMFLAVIMLSGAVSIISSYSRSAWLGLFLAIAIIAFLCLRKKFSTKLWIIIFASICLILVGLTTFVKSDLISSVLLHDSPETVGGVDSNAQHVSSLTEGFGLMLSQPIGAGVGSTGSASLLGNMPVIIENQYLFIAHEAGWLGLIIFSAICAIIFSKLRKAHSNWFGLGVFASGIGLFVIGLFLPVFADDVVSIIWWGLAAICIAESERLNEIKN